MNFSGFTEGIYMMSEWLMRLAILNILWVLFTITGFGVFGWAPATAAMFSILRKWFLFKNEVPIFKTFKEEFKKEFLRANSIGFLIGAGTLSFYFTSMTVFHLKQGQLLIFGFLIIAFMLFSIFTVFIFPVFTHYETTIKQYIRFALSLGVAHLHYYFGIIIAFILIYYLYMAIPGIMLFYMVSIPAAVCMFFSSRIFTIVEDKENFIKEKSITL